MTFDNIDLYRQVLGSIMKQPVLLHNTPNPIELEDFDKGNEIARVVFTAVNNIAANESRFITRDMIEAYVAQFEGSRNKYNRYNGPEFVQACLDVGAPENFTTFYNQLKKTSLLRELKQKGYPIAKYDFVGAAQEYGPGSPQEVKAIKEYDAATEEEILGYVERQFSELRSRYAAGAVSSKDASDGIFDLINHLGENGDYGLPLAGEMFNSIVRGARLGTMYVRSASTGGGKTRSSIFDACEGIYPIIFDTDKNCFRYTSAIHPVKTLFIVTEQTLPEIQLTMLAYISGVEERRIKTNLMTPAEKTRVMYAAKIMDKYKGYFAVEEINDPNLVNVSNAIKKHIIQNNVKYIYYDYIFSSPSMVSKMNGLREDVILMLMSNQLKELAKTYDVFIMSATQLNGDGLKPGVKRDQSMLRGAKSIADKADVAMIISEVTDIDREQIKTIIDKIGVAPTHVIDFYKIRSGRFRGTRLWTKYNLGNGRRKDLFITTSENALMTFEDNEKVEDWRRYGEDLSLPQLDKLLEEIKTEPEMDEIGKDDIEF